MKFATLRKSLLAFVLSVAAITTAQASTVLNTTGFLTSSTPAVILPFSISTPGSYVLTLSDLGASGDLFAPFSFLGATIGKPSPPVFSYSVNAPGTYSFSVTNAGSYFAAVGGTLSSGGHIPQGFFGIDIQSALQVSAVPLPASVLLLGSALVGMMAMGRRRQTARTETREE